MLRATSRTDGDEKRFSFLSIVIPAYNEERRLPSTLDRLLTFLPSLGFERTEILVVDDGSSDGTCSIVESYSQRAPSIGLLRNPGNRGKGFAVRNGMLHANGDLILFTDADLSAPIEEIHKLLSAVIEHGADGAIGSRALDRSLINVHQSVFREYSGHVFNLVVRLSSGLPYRDTQCGFKLYTASAARQIFSLQQLDGFSFDVEDLLIARQLGLRVVEIPVSWSNIEGTKVSMLAGLRSFIDVLRIRWYQAKGLYSLR